MPLFQRRPPSRQTFTSGSGTYNTPAGALYIRIRMVGGGGGGSGSGTGTPSLAGTGGTTTFGTALLVAAGGGPASQGHSVGGTASIAAPAFGIAIQGAGGAGNNYNSTVTSQLCGAVGGVSPFGGAGPGASNPATGVHLGQPAIPNTGSGGGGAGTGGIANAYAGAGGGAGGYVDAVINNPLASYSYSVGTAGTAGAASASGTAGGAGGSGVIIVEEYYS